MNRRYDLIVYGATGYLGPLISHHISATAPATLRWAIAGRNVTKLKALSERLREAAPHVKPPAFEVAALEPNELDELASKTRLILNLAGPFCKHGTAVVEACIRQSTSYIDPAGEHTWSHQIATTLHDRAAAQRVPIIPHCAVESSPPDLMTFLLLNKIREHQLTPAGPVYFSIRHPWPGYAGSTIAAILGVLDSFSLSQISASSVPLAFCVPGAGPNSAPPVALLPVRHDPFLGHLTFNPSAMTDRAVVMRTWSLLQRYGEPDAKYGERFSFQGYSHAANLLQGWLAFLGLSVMTLLVVLLPPLRTFLAWIAPAPGTGPQVTKGAKDFVEWRAVMEAQQMSRGRAPQKVRVTGTMRIDLDPYSCSAVFVAEAALAALEELGSSKSSSLLNKLQGGVLTPASIGPAYVSRLEKAGLQIRLDLEFPGKEKLR
ncbi:Saccharopine dehydrogenase [Tolypocladium capitatum]|uniref:Saccharopine dehydrogenase n=1 Tax=Tolypocladium capitatum TaxID=45235 RepID=A0A2K3QD61_9HYPO|nr:Saccharopine dehydrogenase [Tolypocladium capitatum]